MKLGQISFTRTVKLLSLRLLPKGSLSSLASHKFYVTDSNTKSFDNTSSSESDEEPDKEFHESAEVKKKILTSALNCVPHFGWSRQSLAAGAQSIGFPGAAHGMFPRGGIELVNHFYITSNEKLSQNLSLEALPKESRRTAAMNFIQNALEQRLRMLVPYVDTWSQALSLMLLPVNVPDSTKNLYTLVDDVCYYAGDRSTDCSWYARRAGIAAVYTATELVLIQDKCDDFAETWAFLSRRMNQLSEADRHYKQTETIILELPGFIESSKLTLLNILGLRNVRH